MVTMAEKEKEAMKSIQEVATRIQDPLSTQEQIATYASKLASATEEKSEAFFFFFFKSVFACGQVHGEAMGPGRGPLSASARRNECKIQKYDIGKLAPIVPLPVSPLH